MTSPHDTFPACMPAERYQGFWCVTSTEVNGSWVSTYPEAFRPPSDFEKHLDVFEKSPHVPTSICSHLNASKILVLSDSQGYTWSLWQKREPESLASTLSLLFLTIHLWQGPILFRFAHPLTAVSILLFSHALNFYNSGSQPS